MTTQAFLARNGLVVNNNLLVVNATSGKVGVNTASPTTTFHVFSNDAVFVPIGNTAQRPAGSNGMFRYNFELNQFEGFTAGTWGSIGGGVTPGGPNTAIQFNLSGALSGSANLTFASDTLSTPTITTPTTQLYLGGGGAGGIGGSITIFTTGGLNLNGNNSFSVAQADTTGFRITKQRDQTVTFVGGGTTVFDCANGNIMTLTMTANTILGQPNNIQPGFYTLLVIQDVTGGRNITSFNGVFKFAGGTVPQQTLTGNAKDIYSFICDGTNFYGSFIPDVR